MGKKLVNIFIKLTSNLKAKFFDKIGIDTHDVLDTHDPLFVFLILVFIVDS